MPQLLESQRDWWRRFALRAADEQPGRSGARAVPALPDSPLGRARMAAEAARLAANLDALERSRAAPEQIAAARSELITLRDRLCRAARDPMH